MAKIPFEELKPGMIVYTQPDIDADDDLDTIDTGVCIVEREGKPYWLYVSLRDKDEDRDGRCISYLHEPCMSFYRTQEDATRAAIEADRQYAQELVDHIGRIEKWLENRPKKPE